MLFLLVARNHEGAEAIATRDRLRPKQFETVRAMAASGAMRIGGAILDPRGGPFGSMAVLDFPSREALDAWLERHPYRVNGVWGEIETWPIQPAPVFAEVTKAPVPPAA